MIKNNILVLFVVLSLISFVYGGFKKTSGGAKQSGNTRCTEFKDQIDPDILLHVPCLLIRLMEQVKHCPANSFIPTFLGKTQTNNISLHIMFHPCLYLYFVYFFINSAQCLSIKAELKM
jgi:hypothetical protein